MAYNNAPFLFLIAFILFAAAYAQSFGPTFNVTGQVDLKVQGRLCCSPTANCPGQGIPNMVISLNCTDLTKGTFQIGQNTTDDQGRFNIMVDNVLQLLPKWPTLPCTASANLPVDEDVCPFLSNIDGTLYGLVQPVGVIPNGTAGFVQYAKVVGWVFGFGA